MKQQMEKRAECEEEQPLKKQVLHQELLVDLHVDVHMMYLYGQVGKVLYVCGRSCIVSICCGTVAFLVGEKENCWYLIEKDTAMSTNVLLHCAKGLRAIYVEM